MKNISKKLLVFQFVIGSILIVLTIISPFYAYWKAVMVGVFISLSGAWIAWAIFRRLPDIVGRQQFYSAMIIYEILKWSIIILLTTFFLKNLNLSTLWVIIGFALTYILSYMSLLCMK